MGTLANGGRITLDVANEEISCLKGKWQASAESNNEPQQIIEAILGIGSCKTIDY